MKQQENFVMTMQAQAEFNRNWKATISEGDGYIVTFKDTTRKNMTSHMYLDTVTHKNFLAYEDNSFPKSDSVNHFKKVYPDQTLGITALIPDDMGNDIPKYGVPTDTGWIFRVINGPITVYAKSADYLTIFSISAIYEPRMDFTLSEIIGMRANDGPIEKLTKEYLLKIIEKDPKAVKSLEKRGLYEAVLRYNKDTEKTTKK